LLVTRGADLAAITPARKTALHIPCEKGLLGMAAILLEYGGDHSTRSGLGWTLLHIVMVMHTNNTELAKLLFRKRRSLGCLNNHQGIIPLHIAAWLGKYEMCKPTIKHGAAASAKDSLSLVSLHKASYSDNSRPMGMLLDEGNGGIDLDDFYYDRLSAASMASLIRCQDLLRTRLEISDKRVTPSRRDIPHCI
jgi:ankyrin repeat protein